MEPPLLRGFADRRDLRGGKATNLGALNRADADQGTLGVFGCGDADRAKASRSSQGMLFPATQAHSAQAFANHRVSTTQPSPGLQRSLQFLRSGPETGRGAAAGDAARMSLVPNGERGPYRGSEPDYPDYDSDSMSDWSTASELTGCRRHWPLISPEESTAIMLWDIAMAFALLIFAFFSPFETAFLKLPESLADVDFFFCLNRVFDMLFTFDLLLQFVVAHQDPKSGGKSFKDPVENAMFYMRCWFWIDLLTILPIDVCIVVSGNRRNNPLAKIKLLKVVRLLRLVRLLKLARLQKVMDEVRSKTGISWAVFSLFNFLLIIFGTSHWMACLWAGVGLAGPSGPGNNWIESLISDKCPDRELRCWKIFYGYLRVDSDNGTTCEAPVDLYSISLYWAVMTLTSIGYGDISATNRSEYWVCIFAMVCMASAWTYVIGGVVAIVGNMQPHVVRFRQTMDDLNYMMEDASMPPDMRTRVRRYLAEARGVSRKRNEKHILEQMSPALQGEIALFLHKDAVVQVSYLKKMDTDDQGHRDILVCAAQRLVTLVFAPLEQVTEPRALFIITDGLCARRGCILSRHTCWGEDMVLQNPRLRDTTVARALTYLHVLSLRAVDISFITSKYPSSRVIIRWAIFKFGVRAAVDLISRNLRHPDVNEDWTLRGGLLTEDARNQLFTDILQGKFKPAPLSLEPYLKWRNKTPRHSGAAPPLHHSDSHGQQPFSQHSAGSSVDAEEESGTVLKLLRGILEQVTNLSRKVEKIEVIQNELLLTFHEHQASMLG